jgi:polysaccharide biosynthesis transport protein
MIAARRPPQLAEVPDDDWDQGPDPGGGSAVAKLDIRRYLDALRRRWWIAAITAVLVTVAAGLWTARQPRLYRAMASVVIETRTPRVLTGVEEVVDVAASGWVPENFFETEYEVMRSRAVARAAAEALGLPRNDKLNGLAGITDPEERAKKLAALDPADLVMGRFTVEPDRKSNIVRVVVVDEDPDFAALLANAAVTAYKDHNKDKRVGGTKEASKWLGAQHNELKKELDKSEQALIQFMEDNDVLNASLDSQLAEVKQRLNAFIAQLAEDEASSIRDSLNVEALKQVREDPALIDTLPEIQQATVVTSLKEKLIELRAMETELGARYLPDHPKMKLVQDQRAAVEAELKREVESVLVALERQKASRENSLKGLRAALDDERGKEARLNKLALEYNRIKRERDTNIQLFEMVTSRMKEADITSALPFNNVRPLDDALAPKEPFKPNMQANILFGFGIGLLLGIILILFLELLDNTMKSEEDIAALNVPFLGLVPIIDVPTGNIAAIRERDLHVLRAPRSAVAECARFIRTNLLFMSPDRPLKMLVVTSPGPQEGKTTTAVNIAVTMAQAGSRTLIVDTDLRRPRLHRVFLKVGAADGQTREDANDVGLSTVLLGEHTLATAIRPTEVEKLDVLVCGPPPPNPAEILLSDRFQEMVNELSAKYDRIIFDTPPIGPVTDPAILGAHVDGVVLVVKCGKTRKDATKQALKSLHDANARVFGAILNDVDVTSKRYSGAYYAYYHRYSGYYGEPDAKDAKHVEPAKHIDSKHVDSKHVDGDGPKASGA